MWIDVQSFEFGSIANSPKSCKMPETGELNDVKGFTLSCGPWDLPPGLSQELTEPAVWFKFR